MILPYRFIALDLETTGLSPETDTIIEIAAIAFSLSREGDNFVPCDVTKKSMLISPRRPLLEEVTMITGITESMLTGKPEWGEVVDRVREFITEDSIIVGHNVLFDVAMLETHGIDLSKHAKLDTFELSEILSQEVESLNLGFLAKHYGITGEGTEHRALTDTDISMKLFCKYLSQLLSLTDVERSIFALGKERESEKNIGLLMEIVDMHASLYTLDQTVQTPIQDEKNSEKRIGATEVISIDGDRETEISLLKNISEKGEHIDIVSMDKNTSQYLLELLEAMGDSACISRDVSRYISMEALNDGLLQSGWERKMTIFLVKILCWLEKTETGLIDELKFYGKEYGYLPWFRMRLGEKNPFFEVYKVRERKSRWRIIDPWILAQEQNSLNPTLVVKDIPLLEEKIRKIKSTIIEFDTLDVYLEELDKTGTIRIRELIRTLEGIYMNVPERPTGDSPYPPGEYGETYFIPQSLVWHKGFIWLSKTTDALEQTYKDWRTAQGINERGNKIRMEYIDRSIEACISFQRCKDTNINAILEISKNQTKLSLIPRDVRKNIHAMIETKYTSTHLYGYGIDGISISHFLQEEAGVSIDGLNTGEKKRQELIVQEHVKKQPGTVILTTSLKHIREIGQSLKHTGYTILMQGISGGKSKMKHIFLNEIENTILIGLIDTWRDEYDVWEKATSIIIAKVPFDPPTDTYYLARTAGMKNNFSLYSEPMAIIRLNTLIGRIRSSGYTGKIYCEDSRLTLSEWGKNIAQELL